MKCLKYAVHTEMPNPGSHQKEKWLLVQQESLKDSLHTRPLGIVRKKWVLCASKSLRTVYTPGHQKSLELYLFFKWVLRASKSLKDDLHTNRLQELCECRGGRPGLSVLMSLTVSVDVKQHWTVLRHWSHTLPLISQQTSEDMKLYFIISITHQGTRNC